MLRFRMLAVVCCLAVFCTAVFAETHSVLQAVDSSGNVTYEKIGADPEEANLVVLEGIVLNNPEDMLDPSSQWQIFLQGEGADTSGSSVWMGKFYQGTVWEEELTRLNASGFREGDRIRVTGYAMQLGGKANINERHSSAPEMNFSIELLQADVGLPAPELTTVPEMNGFDPTRQSGGERYQNRRIRLEHVSLDSGSTTWASNSGVTIVAPDDSTQTLPLKLCNVDFGSQVPATWFNIVGLGNQEPEFAGYPVPGTGLTDGYQIWVTRADGIEVPGDCNLDGSVTVLDMEILAGNWNQTDQFWGGGDFTGDGLVNESDLALLGANWSYGPVDESLDYADALSLYSLPEPTTMALLLLGIVGLRRRNCA